MTYLVPLVPAADDREITLERAPDRLRGNERRSSSAGPVLRSRTQKVTFPKGVCPAREAGRSQSGMSSGLLTTTPKRSPIAARLAACSAATGTGAPSGPGSSLVAVALAVARRKGLLDDYAQFAQTRQGLCQRCRRCVRPQIPGLSPGGLGPHRTPSGFPCGLSSGFPVARRVLPLRPPSSGFPSSGVLQFVPFGRCPVPVPPRFPSGFPFPWAIFTLALPRGGSTGVGPGRPGLRSPALPRPPRLDRAIRPHSRWAAAGHDGMPPQNRLLRAAPSAGHRRARTAQIGTLLAPPVPPGELHLPLLPQALAAACGPAGRPCRG